MKNVLNFLANFFYKKNAQIFLITGLLTLSFLLSKGNMVVMSSIFHFIIFGYVSLIWCYSDIKIHLKRPKWFSWVMALLLCLFLMTLSLGIYFSGVDISLKPEILSVFLVAGIGVPVGGLISHRLIDKNKDVYNFGIFFSPKISYSF